MLSHKVLYIRDLLYIKLGRIQNLELQVALVICGLFICDFAYMQSRNDLFYGTYPLIISHPWSFCMQIHYMRVYFWSPYLSHITRSNCTVKLGHNDNGFDEFTVIAKT